MEVGETMRKYIIAAFLTLLWPALAGAMSQSDIPSKFPIPWANGAGAPYVRVIPQASQIGSQNCAASLTDGFPPLTFLPAPNGGCPPFGQDFNGIFKQLSQWARWQGAGGLVPYDSSFSSSIGGYPNGAALQNASIRSCAWISTVDNNASDPDTGGANWIAACPGGGNGGVSTGSANSQTITATPFVVATGATFSYIAGFTNTSSLSVTVNGVGPTQVYRRTQLGTSLTVGGEVIANQQVRLMWDGTRWQCLSCEIAMVGAIRDFAGTSAPTGWLFIDGSCQAQATYADLFSVVSTSYGSCSAGQFALPDGRGTVLAGLDNMGSNGAANRLTSGGSSCAGTTIGTVCGAQNQIIAQANLPAVTLSTAIGIGQGSHSHNLVNGAGSVISSANGTGSVNPAGTNNNPTTIAAATLPAMTGTTPLGGSGTALTTVQPLQVVTKIIKF
jgi:microcystin-dependent protein